MNQEVSAEAMSARDAGSMVWNEILSFLANNDESEYFVDKSDNKRETAQEWIASNKDQISYDATLAAQGLVMILTGIQPISPEDGDLQGDGLSLEKVRKKANDYQKLITSVSQTLSRVS